MDQREERELRTYVCWLQEDLDQIERGALDTMSARGRAFLIQTHLSLLDQIQRALFQEHAKLKRKGLKR